ncbi:hypothetical protein D3C80_805980 [compost metagenome]
MIDGRDQHRSAHQAVQARLCGQPLLRNTMAGTSLIVHIMMRRKKRLIAVAVIILRLIHGIQFPHGARSRHDRQGVIVQPQPRLKRLPCLQC